MNKYYLHDGDKQLGPFDKFELKENNIKIDTPIWHEGLSDWTTAGDLDELKELFLIIPPPFKKVDFETNKIHNQEDKSTAPPFVKKTKTEDGEKDINSKKLKLSLFHYIAISSIVIISIISFLIYDKSQEKIVESENQAATANETLSETQKNLELKKEELKKTEDEKQKAEEEKQRVLNEQNSPEKLRENLIAKEMQSPNQYLKTINETMQENITQQPDLFHHTKTDGYWVRGYIRNSATLATFKDIVIIIKYSTETNTHISDDVFTISKYLRPQTSIPFEHLCHPPQGFVNNWTCEVKDATPN